MFVSLPFIASSKETIDEENYNKKVEQGAYSSKDEVIYGNLDVNGKIENMYVVNTFRIKDKGEIVDYGEYTKMRNLTDLSDIEQVGDKVYFQAKEKEYYYQGELEGQSLPWDISIAYLLDGREVNADELAGQHGALEIQISTTQNPSVNPLFFENYLLQISLTLNPLIFDNIHAPKGTEANAGKNKQIAFSIMPEQEEDLIISANVTNLELDPIEIMAIPANIAMEDPDFGSMSKNMQSLSDGIGEVHSGVTELNKGIQELDSGAKKLSKGSTDYRKGIKDLNQSSGEIVNGSEQINEALKQINNSMQQAPELPDLTEFKKLSKGLRDIASNLENIDGVRDENIVALKEIAKAIESGIESLNQLDALTELHEGLSTLASEYEPLHRGLTHYTEGVNSLASSYKQLDNGIQQLSGGTSSLHDGASELQKGTKELRDSTSNLPGQMKSEIEEQLQAYDFADFAPVSFVSEQNKDVEVVQFVLKTESIEIKEQKETKEVEKEEKSFWSRFLELFK